MKKINTKINHRDERGIIRDLIEKEKISSITYITFSKNSVRGNHFHKKTIQWNFIIFGEVLFVSKINGKIRKIKGIKNDLVKIETMEHHAIKALKKTEILVFTKGPRSARDYEKDTFRLKENLLS